MCFFNFGRGCNNFCNNCGGSNDCRGAENKFRTPFQKCNGLESHCQNRRGGICITEDNCGRDRCVCCRCSNNCLR